FWRLRAWVDADSSQWSDVWSFTTEPGVGIGTIDALLAEINIFPNPSYGKIFLTTECNENSTVQLIVMDLLGQVVMEKELSFVTGFNSKEIIIDDISKGIYIIKIQKDEGSISQKIIIDK
ncbi:MAG: T9SS type A sorting domain-containing protein, partial [Bacteroidales bacterium]|nr:T9SS type A sorting domain-containing protein [Bacteroidales bacterium]